MTHTEKALIQFLMRSSVIKFLLLLLEGEKTAQELALDGVRGVSVGTLLIAGLIEKTDTGYILTPKGVPLATALKSFLDEVRRCVTQ